MNSLINIPFPRPELRTYLWISISIALSVFFILFVFQPFGTSSFDHPNKNLILSGYPLVIFSSLSIYYFLSLRVFNKSSLASWTIVKEVLDIFISVLFSLLACYFYASWVFSWPLSLLSMGGFLSRAASVALLPILIYLVFLYFKWKDSYRSTLEQGISGENQPKQILLKGENKDDRIETDLAHVLYLQAHDNYVMLYLEEENRVQRHILRSTLKDLQQQLGDEDFPKVHRSYVVNRSRIEEIKGNKSKANLKISGTDKLIPLGRSFYDRIKYLA